MGSVCVCKHQAKDIKHNKAFECHLQGSLLQIPDLVTPLGHDSQCILQESYNDQEPTNGRQMGFQRLGVNFNIVFNSFAESSQFFDRVVRVGGSVACCG